MTEKRKMRRETVRNFIRRNLSSLYNMEKQKKLKNRKPIA